MNEITISLFMRIGDSYGKVRMAITDIDPEIELSLNTPLRNNLGEILFMKNYSRAKFLIRKSIVF